MTNRPLSDKTIELLDKALEAVIGEAYERAHEDAKPAKPTPANLAANMHFVFIQTQTHLGTQYQLRHLAWVAKGAKSKP
jgi:diacylglycerol kinase